ncbi:HEAT repeat domain-containing protein [Oceaniferula spumae]
MLLILLVGAQITKADELEPLVAELVKLSTPDSGVGSEMQALTAKFSKLDHKEVVAAMLPLLKHKNKRVVYHAGYVILVCRDGVVPAQLDALIAGHQNGSGWLPYAIRSIDNQKAIAYLADNFRHNPQTMAPVYHSLIGLGEKAVPDLLRNFELADPLEEADYFHGLRAVFGEMEEKAGVAIPDLMNLVRDDKIALALRKEAILTIGHIGESAERVIPELLKMADRDHATWGESVESAVIASNTSFAAVILFRQADGGKNPQAIYQLAEQGGRAVKFGPKMMPWLKSDSKVTRAAVIHAIGAINYRDGAKELIPFLTESKDWTQAEAAAKSLAQLQCKAAVPALKRAAKDHWFPLVHTTAMAAVRVIETDADYLKTFGEHGYKLHNEFQMKMRAVDERDEIPAELTKLMPYNSIVEEFAIFGKREPKIAEDFIRLRDTNGEQVLMMSNMESLSLPGGMLLAAAAGEWTGGLQYVPKKGKQVKLMGGNFYGLRQWGDHILTSEGTLHMGMNDGALYKITANEHTASIELWFVLPSCPSRIEVSRSGQLVVTCFGCVIAISPDGKVSYYRQYVNHNAGAEEDPFDS